MGLRRAVVAAQALRPLHLLTSVFCFEAPLHSRPALSSHTPSLIPTTVMLYDGAAARVGGLVN